MMRSVNGIGLGLSLVFGCLLLALVVELFYILWWKKRVLPQSQQTQHQEVVDGEAAQNKARYFLSLFCCKNVLSLSTCGALNPRRICASVGFRESQQQQGLSNSKGEDVFLWQTGPPRFLFTIKEETVEDLESEDTKSVQSRKASTSLNELLLRVESHTPYLTPLSSPPITPTNVRDHGFNPFLESSTDAEISKINASPPPKFSFLLAAEDKFRRKMFMEEENSHC